MFACFHLQHHTRSEQTKSRKQCKSVRPPLDYGRSATVFKPFYHYASYLMTSKRLSLPALSHYRSTLCNIRTPSIMLFLSHSFLPRPSPQKRSPCPLLCIISSPTLFFLFHGYQYFPSRLPLLCRCAQPLALLFSSETSQASNLTFLPLLDTTSTADLASMSTNFWPLSLINPSLLHLIFKCGISIVHLVVLIDSRWLHLWYWARRTCSVNRA